MFKKVQIKFVTTTMSIILAIFIAVLGSINLIMQNLMQRQSKVILSKIATNIKYDEKTSVFTFIPQDDEPPIPDKKGNKWELNPNEESEVPPSESSQSQTSQTETSKPVTENISEPPESSQSNDIPVYEEVTQPKETESKQQNITEPTETTDAPKTEVTKPPITTVIPPITETVPPTENSTSNYPVQPDWNEEYPEFPYPEHPFEENPNYEQFPEKNPDNYYNNEECPHEEFNPYPNKENFSYYNDFFYYDEYIQDTPCFKSEHEKCNDMQEYQKYEEYYCEETEATTEDFTEPIEIIEEPHIEELSYTNDSILSDYEIVIPSLMANEFSPPPDMPNMKKNGEIPPATIDSIEYFVLMADTSGQLLDIFNQDDMDTSLAQRYINSILNDGAITGMIGSLQFYTAQKENGTVMVFTDKTSEIEMLDSLIKTTLLIGSLSFVCLSILVMFLSRKSIEPVKQAFEKQKQFVSDASHELKTPLTIISANADVLAGEIGENKWLTYIQSQTERMSLLVNDLLNLTRLENNSSDMTFSEFNLSQAVMSSALPFECQAFESGKTLEVDVEEGLMLTASERHIKQLIAIFIDNAVKHSNENGLIKVSLAKQGDKKIFSVYNTGSKVRNDEKDRLFERFYRSDDSRSRNTGGYGLGLAIAKSIIDYHKFKLNIDNNEGEYIKFTITMQ